jgi:hypothetical protein
MASTPDIYSAFRDTRRVPRRDRPFTACEKSEVDVIDSGGGEPVTGSFVAFPHERDVVAPYSTDNIHE